MASSSFHTFRRVGIVSSAQTNWRHSWSQAQHIDLISSAVIKALNGSGLRIEDVDFVIDSGSDVLDGRSISNCGFLGAMGAHHKEESRVEDDGLWAAQYGVNKIASGSADVGVIIAYAKPSEASVDQFHSTIAEPFCQRPIGFDEATAQGFLAQAYLRRHGLSEKTFAEVTAYAWANASLNPNLNDVSAIGIDQILSSPFAATPLRELMMARPVDGAVVVVLTSERVAARVTRTPVWITGMGSSMDSGNYAMRDSTFSACEIASKAAHRVAGIHPKDIGLVEVSATSAVSELLTLEALGIAEAGCGIGLYRGEHKTVVNLSGGSLPAWPVFATGLVRLAEASDRLVAGKGNRKAIVHASSGLGAQSHCVFIIEA